MMAVVPEAKRRKLRSIVWEYFISNVERSSAKCKLCSLKTELKTTNGSTSTLSRHLQSVHGVNIKSTSDNDLDVPRPDSVELIARFAASDGIPFSTLASSSSFQTLFQLSGYSSVPCTGNGVREVVLKCYNMKKQAVAMSLKTILKTGLKFSITIDEWTSAANRRYLNLNVHSVDGQFWNLGLVKLSGSVTSEVLLASIKAKLHDFGISYESDIVCMTTDGASVMKKLGRIFGKEQQLCFAHAIHLAIVDTLYKPEDAEEPNENSNEDVELNFGENSSNDEDLDLPFQFEEEIPLELNPDVGDIVKKVRNIVKKFRNSPLKDDMLKKYTTTTHGKELGLILDVCTRWNSLLSMLERFVLLRNEVEKVLESIFLVESEYYIVQELIRVLKPVKLVVEAICKRDMNLFDCDTALNFMMNKIKEKQTPISEKLYNSLEKRIMERRTFLSDLMYYLRKRKVSNEYSHKCLKGIRRESELRNHIKRLAEMLNKEAEPAQYDTQLSTICSSNEIFEDSQAPEMDMEHQLYAAITLANNTGNSREYAVDKTLAAIKTEMSLFESGGSRGKILEKVHNLLRTIPPTSVESERAFSSANYFCSRIRSRLADLDALLFLRANFRSG